MTKDDFNLFGYSNEEIEKSGFEIVADVWAEDNPNATNTEKDKFVKKFFKGYKNRPTHRKGNPSKTVSDPLVSTLVAIKTGKKSTEGEITKVHKASMASENLIGALLEEYIADNSLDKGWANCWGTTIKATDFVSKKGERLQIKNKTNTENSSSNKIRKGTNIDVWHRFDANNGKTYWSELNEKIGQGSNLSEEGFQDFAKKAMKDNPEMLNLGDDN